MALGLSTMAVWAYFGLRYRRLALMCAVFASAPAFQLFWAGFAMPYGRAVVVVPAAVVPAVTIATVVVLDRRRQKSEISARDR